MQHAVKIIPMRDGVCLDTHYYAYPLSLADMQRLRDELTAQIARVRTEQAQQSWQSIDPFCPQRAAVS